LPCLQDSWVIEAAEESGNLDVILQRATTYYEKIAAIKKERLSVHHGILQWLLL